ncbi:MAG: class I SAM-dependent methyltransferase [Burkholderiaceae bacterium]|nr:class I SAM-dependent methyltransferase [Burkholderiaceae bacterium]MCD8516957.1 class I SAM-dependent methyltransferase [Burkholderiaceae bacterium]MCD8536791.1 class I SAM-dependent methyltransferase [Burkholderiaceae bacterium]MCD8565666.1 class I SAM-dependent methyltransferase [Burkholderiaceae bacterium]
MSINAQTPIVELQRWFDSPVGRYVHRWEQQRIDDLLVDVFGYRAIQYGLADFNYLAANRMPFKAYAGPRKLTDAQRLGWQASLVCQPEEMPFDSDSIDLLVLPHTLETSEDQHMVLREAHRVLMPEGRLVIAGFNPWSLWGLRARLPWISPWFPTGDEGELSPNRLKDWLKLLSFEIDRGHFGCYAPPCRSQEWLDRFDFMDPAGDRWWPIFGATYVVSAVKRVAGMRLITPVWKRKSQRRSARATAGVASQRQGSR